MFPIFRVEPGVPGFDVADGNVIGGPAAGGQNKALPRVQRVQEQDKDQRQQLHRYNVRQSEIKVSTRSTML